MRKEGGTKNDAGERFRRADAVFDAALDLAPAERAAFVRREAAGDTELCFEVLRLLDAHDRAGDFLAHPAAAVAAPLLGGTDPAEDSGSPALPERIGPYRILRELGRGGMGVVYLAERDDPQFRQRIALKLVRGDPLASPALVQRFLAEREVLASLDHPHIVRFFDGGITPDGLPYLTMAHYAGGSLADRLASGGALPLEDALRIARQIAGALGAAHRLRIVHRDVKPGNILFDAAGGVRLSDFGVARLLDGDATRSGTVLGSIAYLAPEQVAGEPVDHRADLWALGVTLYEMLAGRRPFAGSHATVLHGIVTAEPAPIRSGGAHLPAAMESLVFRLLHKSPAERPEHADAVLEALERVRPTSDGGAPPPPPRTPTRGASGPWRWVAGAGLLVAVGLTGVAAWKDRGAAHDASTAAVAAPLAGDRPSVAVLPFANTSGDPADAHFSDGLTDELINALGEVPGLRVAGRTSAFATRGKGFGLRTIADTLGVGAVVEGSVRRVGTRLKVGVQLVSAEDGAVVWRETYDRELRDIFAVQEEIAQAIVGALRVELAVPGAPRTTDPATYELYLRGRYVFNSRPGRDGIRQAARFFEQAIALDPSFARAHAGLSDAHARLATFGYGAPREEFARAQAAARTALALDSALAEAHAALGHTLFIYEFDRAAAERAFRRAIALDPGYTYARVMFAICLQDQARFDEALAQLDTARAIDPLSPAVSNVLGRVYVSSGQPDLAIRHLRAALELNPQIDLAYQQLGHAYLLKGRAPDAIDALRRAAALSGPRDSAQLAYAYAVTGQRAEALGVVRSLVDPSRRNVPSFHVAMAYAGLGDADAAFRWLERGYEERGSFMDGVGITAAFAPLHDDPRWPRLLRRMGLEALL